MHAEPERLRLFLGDPERFDFGRVFQLVGK